eukprot:4032218-Pyramimonas_sp.AAC.1
MNNNGVVVLVAGGRYGFFPNSSVGLANLLAPVKEDTTRDKACTNWTRSRVLTTDQSDTGSVGMFSRRTNQTQEAW